MKLRWPWVSRKRLEDAERRLAEVDQERRTLLRRLFDREDQVPTAPVVVKEESSQSKDPIQFSTPFDRVEREFDRAGASARKPQFKARMR